MPKKEPVSVETAKIAVWGTIVVAVIGLIGILAPLLIQKAEKSVGKEAEYIGRVIDNSNQRPIAGAEVALNLEGVPPIVYTDSEGVYRFQVIIESNISGQIRIDATRGNQCSNRNSGPYANCQPNTYSVVCGSFNAKPNVHTPISDYRWRGTSLGARGLFCGR